MNARGKTVALAVVVALLYAGFVYAGLTAGDGVNVVDLRNALDGDMRPFVTVEPAATVWIAPTEAPAPSATDEPPLAQSLRESLADSFAQEPTGDTIGASPAQYLKSLGLSVYTAAEFSSLGNGEIFTQKPNMTLLAYLPGDMQAIIWHDGDEGYVAADMVGVMFGGAQSLRDIYADMCRLYDFELYLTGTDAHRIAYAKKKQTIAEYCRQTGATVDEVFSSLDRYLDHLD